MARLRILGSGRSLGGTLKALVMLREKSTGAKFPLNGDPQSRLVTVGLAVAVGLAYFLAALLGLALRANTGTSVFWPAAGISVGTLIVCGPRARLPVAAGVVVATVLANVMVGRSPWLAAAFGFVNAGQAILTTALIERWFGRTFKLGNVPQILGFLAGSTIGSAVAATGATIAVTLLQSTASIFIVWRVWFGSCLLGIITVAPLITGIAEAVRQLPARRELFEGLAGLLILAALSVVVISLPQGPWSTALPLALVFPVLLWVAVRCRPVFAAAAAFVVASAVVWSITFSVGHFGDVRIPLEDRVLTAQTIVLTGTLLTLVLAALFAERRRTELELERSKQRLQLALDGAELGAFSADLYTGKLEWDARAALIHGHTEQSTTIRASRRFVHPDDLVRLDAALSKAQHASGIWNAEYRVMHPPGRRYAGETRWVAVDGSIVRDPETKNVGLLGVTRDITDRKKTEQAAQRLALIVESSDDAVISKDLSGVIVSWNKGAEQIFGYTAEEVLGKPILLLIPPDRHHEELTILQRIRCGERLRHYETVRRRKDGSLVDISLTVSPLRDAAGVIVGASKIARDISTRKRAEEHQRALNAELDHRVKNVLATVCAIIDQTRAASSRYADFVVGLDRRIRSLANTHDLLSRAHWHGVALAEIVQREFTPYGRGNSEARGPSVTLKAEAAQAVAMVLHELTTNAAKFGAFSNRNGRVLLKWRWQQNGGRPRLVIDWKEVGGPPVEKPSRSGYGTSVVRELIPFELEGTVDLDFPKDGFRCRLEIPANWVSTGVPASKSVHQVDTTLAALSN
jgi:PAS domain S-box-containing protein